MPRFDRCVRPQPVVLLITLALLAGVVISALFGTATGRAAPVTGHQPLGHADQMYVTGNTFLVSGWAADPDGAAPVLISITLNGLPARTLVANQPRPDVAAVYPSLGAARGFSTTLPLPGGDFSMCVIANNVGAGSNTVLQCAVMSVGPITAAPIGHVDGMSLTATTLRLAGWTFDTDTPASAVIVGITVNGRSVAAGAANLSRPDVGAVFPAAGRLHGMPGAFSLPIDPGNYRICVVARNTQRGASTQLACAVLTLQPVGLPDELNQGMTAAAANALMAQAIASHATTAADFHGTTTDASRLARAAQRLLAQAAGRTAAPAAVSGLPAFKAATPMAWPDTQLVMGRAPTLSTDPAARTGGRTGVSHALEAYANDPVPFSGAPGVGIVGAAAVLTPNGVSVDPAIVALPASPAPLRAQLAVAAALAELGNPYVYAAGGPGSFDCSGLTEWAWAKAGVNLYHYTGTQAVQGVRVLPNQLLPGDLVLFGSDLHHVGMYLGAGYMIDAPYTGTYVRIDRVADYGDFTLAVRP